MMGDITSPKLILVKGFLFLLAGLMACAAILLEHPEAKLAFLLAVSVWCFARFYYFAFYVIEHYIDPGYKFAGLGSFVLYMMRSKKGAQGEKPSDRREDEGSDR